MLSCRFVLLAFLLSGSVFAAGPIAILTAGADAMVNGKLLPTAGAPNWGLEFGDEVLTGAAAAALAFPEGAQVTLGPGTRVLLRKCDHCLVQLLQGTADYVKPKGSKLEICALGHPVRPDEQSQGTVRIEPKDKVIVRVADKERVVTSGACSCNGGAPVGVLAVILGAGTLGTVAVVTPEDASVK